MHWYQQVWATEAFLGMAFILCVLFIWSTLKVSPKIKYALIALLAVLMSGCGLWLYLISPQKTRPPVVVAKRSTVKKKTTSWQPPVLTGVPVYEVLAEEDLSTPEAAKRVIKIWLDKATPKEQVKLAIADATYAKLKRTTKKGPASSQLDVIWVYVFNKKTNSVEDLVAFDENVWFVGQSQWIDPGLTSELRPSSIEPNDKFDQIEIRWSSQYTGQ